MQPISPSAPPLRGPVVAAQDWEQVAFVHWRVPRLPSPRSCPPASNPT